MTTSDHQQPKRGRVRWAAVIALVAGLIMVPDTFYAQVDICGCATIPGLQPFDTHSTPATYPAGTFDDGTSLIIPLPADGILRFSSFRVQNRQVSFRGNAANSPVTLLVAGDVTFAGATCCYLVVASGGTGSGGTGSIAGVGGAGGPGGFRGGDGAAVTINGASIGGAGFGPGGGAGGTRTPFTVGLGGTFLGVPELMPLLGGSGGGGGASGSAESPSCTGGGGGGGAGGLLIAANGTLTLTNYFVFVEGGNGAGAGASCATSGGGGSGGPLRLVATRLVNGGSANLFTRGGGGGSAGTDGRIRLESIDTSAQTTFTTTPAAQRVVGPTPIANPVAPSISITTVGGNPVPAVPQGTFGAIDIVLAAPGDTGVSVVTSGVPSGTTVLVTVKPRIGGLPQSQTVPLTGCDGLGNCQASATFNLVAGAYVVEARATFQTQ